MSILTLIIIIMLFKVILSVAFVTLLERKWLGSLQRRIGPNVIGYYGILQPILDGVKLILKENIIIKNVFSHIIPSILVFVFGLLIYNFLPHKNIIILNTNLSLLYIFGISTLGIYGILLGGYYSNSKYGLLGSLRGISQLISYEVSIGFVIISLILITDSLNINEYLYNQLYISNIWINVYGYILLLICILAETNRTPFDLLEAESELVAGFLVEYSSITFVFYYLAEYTMILVWCYLGSLFYSVNVIITLLLFIILRGTLPRLKYNQLIWLGWLLILPLSIIIYLYYYSLYFLFNLQ